MEGNEFTISPEWTCLPVRNLIDQIMELLSEEDVSIDFKELVSQRVSAGVQLDALSD